MYVDFIRLRYADFSNDTISKKSNHFVSDLYRNTLNVLSSVGLEDVEELLADLQQALDLVMTFEPDQQS